MGFKFEKNLPAVYVQESRDFQLLCHIADIYFCGCMNKVASMRYQLDLDNCSEDLLWAVAYKYGFTTSMYFPPEVLRNVCRVFPYCISRKGTKEAIEVASLAVLSVDRLLTNISVELRTTDGMSDANTTGSFTLYVESTSPGVYTSPYLKYLDEVLSFLIPCGWGISYSIRKTTTTNIVGAVQSVIKVGVVSTITSRIATDNNLVFKISDSPTENKFNKTYSRMGAVRLLRARDGNSNIVGTEYIKQEYHYTGENDKLVGDDGTNYVYGQNVEEDNNG